MCDYNDPLIPAAAFDFDLMYISEPVHIQKYKNKHFRLVQFDEIINKQQINHRLQFSYFWDLGLDQEMSIHSLYQGAEPLPDQNRVAYLGEGAVAAAGRKNLARRLEYGRKREREAH